MNKDKMSQLSLFGTPGKPHQTIVNTASVKHRSPFRYPGGKTWLVPHAKQWLTSLDEIPSEFIEPFAGGGIIGLTAAFENLARHVILAELDEQVAVVWQTIIEIGEGEWLADQIKSFELNLNNVDKLLSRTSLSIKDQALQTIIKNRINRGGILAEGAGRIKNGEKGRGITSRWYPETLSKRILDISNIRQKLSFIYGDGFHVIQKYLTRPDVVFFVDPPYTASEKKPGKRLYNYSEINHEALFDLLGNVDGDFLMTYENHQHVRTLAQYHNFDIEVVSMKNTHHAPLTEVLIGKDLSWFNS